MANPHITFKPYRRRFRIPLRTAYGDWSSERMGILIKAELDGHTGYGEVAPLPEFGTETVDEALTLLKSYPHITPAGIVNKAPATAFGLSCALHMCQSPSKPRFPPKTVGITSLIGGGVDAVNKMKNRIEAGYTSFKWKMGIEKDAIEKIVFEELVDILRASKGKIRVDGNRTLSARQLEEWIILWEKCADVTEFIEEPAEPELLQNHSELSIPFALDESLCGNDNFSHHVETWSGLFILKPAISGNTETLEDNLKAVGERVILSSSFETAIGQWHSFRIAANHGPLNFSIGYGTDHYFGADGLGLMGQRPTFDLGKLNDFNPVEIWDRL